MLVKTPLKKKEAKKNKRKKPPQRKKDRKKSSQANHGKRKSDSHRFSLPKVASWKIILGIIIVGLCGILYLKNVFATQKLLAKVQQQQQKYNHAKRSYDNFRLKYDQMIGPSEIYKKAKARGFINGGPAEKVLTVDTHE